MAACSPIAIGAYYVALLTSARGCQPAMQNKHSIGHALLPHHPKCMRGPVVRYACRGQITPARVTGDEIKVKPATALPVVAVAASQPLAASIHRLAGKLANEAKVYSRHRYGPEYVAPYGYGASHDGRILMAAGPGWTVRDGWPGSNVAAAARPTAQLVWPRDARRQSGKLPTWLSSDAYGHPRAGWQAGRH
ncbi:hypothetical protein ZWY2020_013620 [Hordeum vulgare]|nr:hypothetical protein ZWY2020_013616 [Hordeum vulgare]KAI5011483.1 hypothetical protein ZWY2020_013620 [Hordeum vulgare]